MSMLLAAAVLPPLASPSPARREEPKPASVAILTAISLTRSLCPAALSKSGFGVFTCTPIEKGSFVLEYCGELIPKEERDKMQKEYSDKKNVYLFDFVWGNAHGDREIDDHEFMPGSWRQESQGVFHDQANNRARNPTQRAKNLGDMMKDYFNSPEGQAVSSVFSVLLETSGDGCHVVEGF
ncbi:Histone-lysine N-methyltransferase [Collichthys lucidus]|uniref:Histone-lysine N-methyltransferase n=1 Tax=Collichthys lucidus TaxID=240159 RepID=A0A4U5UD59_COLLU|nr:Histone-lysine N-methyltransferase [Collichthys lucidus]